MRSVAFLSRFIHLSVEPSAILPPRRIEAGREIITGIQRKKIPWLQRQRPRLGAIRLYNYGPLGVAHLRTKMPHAMFGLTSEEQDLELMETPSLLDRLASHRTIGPAPRTELAWIATHSTLRKLAQGELLQSQREIVQDLFIVLSGRVSIHVDRGAGLRRAMEWKAGDVTGLLPYSRTQYPPGDAIVDEAAEIVSLRRIKLRILSTTVLKRPQFSYTQ